MYLSPKLYIYYFLIDFCKRNSLTLQTEYKFLSSRKFKFDWAIFSKNDSIMYFDSSSLKIAIEYEGIYSEKSRHTTFDGYSGDLDKYNLAVIDGWKVLRYSAKNYKKLPSDLEKLIIAN